MKRLIILTAILLNSWIASSQISGLEIQQKQEIVTALIEYPFLKQQVSAEAQLRIYAKQALKDLESIITSKDKQIQNLEEINKLLQKQVDLSNEQLKVKNKSNGWIWLLTGLATGITTGVLLGN